MLFQLPESSTAEPRVISLADRQADVEVLVLEMVTYDQSE